MIDILNEINNGTINIEQADVIFSETVDKFHNGELDGEIPSELMLNNYEWTALCHGAEWEILSEWRKNGWSDKCGVCGKPLDYTKYGWSIKKGRQLCHITCKQKAE